MEIKQVFPKKNIYYHLRELRKSGLIKLSEGNYDLTEKGREICRLFLELARAVHAKNYFMKVLEEDGFVRSYAGIDDFFEKKNKVVMLDQIKKLIRIIQYHGLDTESLVVWTLLESLNNDKEVIIGVKDKTLNLTLDLEACPLFKYFRIVEHVEAIFRQNAVLNFLNYFEKIKDAFLNGEIAIRRPEFTVRGVLGVHISVQKLENKNSSNLIKHLLKIQHHLGEIYISGISELKIEDFSAFLENLSMALPGKGRIALVIRDYELENEKVRRILSLISPRYEPVRVIFDLKEMNLERINIVSALLNSGVPITFDKHQNIAMPYVVSSQISIIIPAIFSREKRDVEQLLQDEISGLIETLRKGIYESRIPRTLQEYLESSFKVRFDDTKNIVGIIGLNAIYNFLQLNKKEILLNIQKLWKSITNKKNDQICFLPFHMGDEPYYSYELAKKDENEPAFSCLSPFIYENVNFVEYLQVESMLQKMGIQTLTSIKLPHRRISAEETWNLLKKLQNYGLRRYYIHRDFMLCLRCYNISYKRRFTCQSCGSIMQTYFISPFSYLQLEKQVHPQAKTEYKLRPVLPEHFLLRNNR